METTNTSGGNKTIVWIAVGCLALLACVVVAFFSGIGGLYWIGSQTPDNADILVNIPSEVNSGESFQIEVVVTNTSRTTIVVSSIDISLNYLSGFLIEGTTPPYAETSQYSSIGGGETFQTYYFHRSLAPEESLTIVFNGRALAIGDYRGNVDVCIDSEFNCKSDIARTIVR